MDDYILRSFSPELWAANQRLHLSRIQKQGTQASRSSASVGFATATSSTSLSIRERAADAACAQKVGLPTPWLQTPICIPPQLAEAELPVHSLQPKKDSITLFPDIGLGILRAEQAAPGRLWLLLRYLDQQGRGWVSVEAAREAFTKKQSELRIAGWRQLRNLLQQGQGVFWQRDGERIWLCSTARVAAALQVERLSGRAVVLPIQTLLNGIGDVRAHLYASFHSGRAHPTDETRCKPIARATLTAISGVGRSSQLNYEQRADVVVSSNIAVGKRVSAESQQERAWQQGQALFLLKDNQGKQGQKGESYLAWQLPNSYTGPHSQHSKRQKRRINRKLADLLNTRATGNNKRQIEQRYFANGAAAVKGGFGRNEDTSCYWPISKNRWGIIHL